MTIMMENTMATAKKTRAEKIADLKAQLAKLEAESEETVEKTSPGVDKLLTAFDDVCKKNKCGSIVVIRSLSKFRKLGLTIEAPVRKKREPKAAKPKQGSGNAGQRKQGTLAAVA